MSLYYIVLIDLKPIATYKTVTTQILRNWTFSIWLQIYLWGMIMITM